MDTPAHGYTLLGQFQMPAHYMYIYLFMDLKYFKRGFSAEGPEKNFKGRIFVLLLCILFYFGFPLSVLTQMEILRTSATHLYPIWMDADSQIGVS